jgi:hypothetical protein
VVRICCPYIWLAAEYCSNGVIAEENRAECSADDATSKSTENSEKSTGKETYQDNPTGIYKHIGQLDRS